jgi:hypothetical protein
MIEKQAQQALADRTAFPTTPGGKRTDGKPGIVIMIRHTTLVLRI